MNPILNSSNPLFARYVCRLFLLAILFLGPRALAQTDPPLTVSIELICHGESLTNGAVIHAPAMISWFPNLKTTLPLHAGDTVNLDFLVDGKKICSGRAEWHDAIGPSNRPGKFEPMIMARAGFGYSLCDWINPAAGTHIVTLLAHGPGKLSATSPPIHITILPRQD